MRVPLHQRTGPKSRARSHSMSAEGRTERGESLGVLKTIQLHARSKHAFAAAPSTDIVPESPPRLVRRNSTSARIDSHSHEEEGLPPLPESPVLARSTPTTDPAAPQSVTEPDFKPEPLTYTSYSDIYLDLKHARNTRDSAKVLALVESLKTRSQAPTTAEANMALEALHETRRNGEPLTILLDTYNWMVKSSVVPNVRTYLVLILALTDRDHEVHKSITTLEARAKRALRSLSPSAAVNSLPDQQRAEKLRTENNFASAMSLFEAATAVARNSSAIPVVIYSSLLRSCAYHANVDAAIHVFAHLERRSDFKPTAAIFSHLISVYTSIGDLQGAREVFVEYRAAVKEDRIAFGADKEASVNESAKAANVIVWNRMIEAYFRCDEYVGALTLLEQMMDSKASANSSCVAEIPAPASSTFTAIIAGFIQAGDVTSALSWFNRLLEQSATSSSPHESLTVPPKPDQVAWTIMIEALAVENMVPDLNRLFAILEATADADGLEIRSVDRIFLFEANLRYIDANPALPQTEVVSMLDVLVKSVFTADDSKSPVKIHRWGRRKILEQLVQRYIDAGAPVCAFDLLEPYVTVHLAELQQREGAAQIKSNEVHDEMHALRGLVGKFSARAMDPSNSLVGFKDALRVLRLSEQVGYTPSATHAHSYLVPYAAAKAAGEKVEMSVHDWELMLFASSALELPHDEAGVVKGLEQVPNTAALLGDMQESGVELSQLQTRYTRRIIKAVFLQHGADEMHALFERLGPSYNAVLDNNALYVENALSKPQPTVSSEAIHADREQASQKIVIDNYHSRHVDEFYPNHPSVTPLIAYSRFEAGLAKGLYPIPATIGRLINALGRLHEMEKVRKLYDTAQIVMAQLEDESSWQSSAWFGIEDSMVIACAHGGEMEAAFDHRARITSQGGTPTPDAYGALIECVKDTTDDTSNAMNLYRESQAVGCVPNVYLFNVIISKLAKARKADHALELFQEMKAMGIRPSSITYGAVIAACARVGDTMSAEQLFIEMSEQPNFKPRIPPFNTMMQMYTHTKPNRERVIFYYNALLEARITPSAHTYKLLLDAYGTIEPVDAPAMDRVFHELENNKRVSIQGAHWASLINAWGCVRKDLNKAVEVFESIASHPSTRRSSSPLPDAVTYEAMINVLVTHRRMDLVPAYMARLEASGIHLTAYIANLLIKGYAAVGDIARAREIFESLEDPPTGVAASSNHVPHSSKSPASSSPASPAAGPCHREPSTWEAMFRAELGSGNRDNALSLLERLKARQYPPAVYNRISGIMLDDSVSPWAAT